MLYLSFIYLNYQNKIFYMKKKTLLVTMCLGILMNLLAIKENQLLITEIMYNPPEEGVDSLEFIRITNVGNEVLNLQGCYFEGINYEIDSNISLAPLEDLILCKNSKALYSIIGLEAIEWTSGSLSNTGETIKLINPENEIIDSVHYKKTGTWPKEANGEGYSIYFCPSISSSNDEGENWYIGYQSNEITDSTTLYVALENSCFEQYVGIENVSSSGVNFYDGKYYLEIIRDGVFDVSIYNLLGQRVYYSRATDIKLIDKNIINDQMYILKVEMDGQSVTRRIAF